FHRLSRSGSVCRRSGEFTSPNGGVKPPLQQIDPLPHFGMARARVGPKHVLSCKTFEIVGCHEGDPETSDLSHRDEPPEFTPPKSGASAKKGLRTENLVSATPITPAMAKTEKSERIWKLLPHIWMLIRPRRWLLALGFGLMAINRVAGLVLPASPKYLIDDIIGRRQSQFLLPL